MHNRYHTTVQLKAPGICDSQVMASENRLIDQRLGTALQAKKPSNGQSQISDENYISCMILLFLLFSGTSTMNRITAVEKETERPVGTSTASVPKVHRQPLDPAFTPMTLVSDLLAQAQSTPVAQGKEGNYKITFPVKKARLPLVNLVNTSQIVTKIQLLKRRGWPKLKRLSQAVHRNSRRILLLRAHLSVLQSEFEERTSSRNSSMKTTVCKQELTETQLPPGRMYLLGSFFIQHFLREYNEGPVDGDLMNMPDLAALLIDQFHWLHE
ncbi:unnamed protein product [Penicillium salamii]|uniref:Uncharacterized protein n=1 Tax=Penicillium salamii TaxID=1612424 RepID=A0A9W4IEN8_9EURO|nr:unnamed protein product [Penicillium salamii]CAG7935808.1 unnamed protein product [Penicillium salamii]CAG7947362.1 unnamed protein product [Penicillium salamii]CAG7948186.1 unnamed protein product [Penicillium salamii]CAG7948837.1 unnamed protein product [Penicillium salamii]